MGALRARFVPDAAPDPYEVLGVAKGADDVVLRAAAVLARHQRARLAVDAARDKPWGALVADLEQVLAVVVPRQPG